MSFSVHLNGDTLSVNGRCGSADIWWNTDAITYGSTGVAPLQHPARSSDRNFEKLSPHCGHHRQRQEGTRGRCNLGVPPCSPIQGGHRARRIGAIWVYWDPLACKASNVMKAVQLERCCCRCCLCLIECKRVRHRPGRVRGVLIGPLCCGW